jgi:F-type H+-transporting ATPase subunit alpha
MSSILQELEAKIQGIQSASTTKTNVGLVREIGDGVARIEGLSGAMLNEMLEFPGGIYGIALNLEETEVGAVILGDYTQIREGDEVKTTGKLLQVPVGKALLGRVVDALGQPIDGKGPVKAELTYPVEKIAPGIIKRKSVSQPVQTGIMAIDAMIPIGRGQRELIIGDRATGKTTIAIDTIINQANANKAAEAAGDKNFRPMYSIYVAVGQKNANIARVVKTLEEHDALKYTIIISAPASESATNQYIAPFSGAAMGEWFMDTAWTRSSCSTISRSTPSPTARSRSSSSVRPAARHIRATCSIFTAVCSSVPPASARITATARSPRCRSSRRRPATCRPTFRRT